MTGQSEGWESILYRKILGEWLREEQTVLHCQIVDRGDDGQHDGGDGDGGAVLGDGVQQEVPWYYVDVSVGGVGYVCAAAASKSCHVRNLGVHVRVRVHVLYRFAHVSPSHALFSVLAPVHVHLPFHHAHHSSHILNPASHLSGECRAFWHLLAICSLMMRPPDHCL